MQVENERSLKIFTQEIEKALNHLIEVKDTLQGTVYEAARYSILGGGKRLRPLLALLTNQMLGGSLDQALIPSCTLEMIHTYSLIHDDLPCMDDDDFRRGKPSLHKAFTEGLAVLTGDYLLTYAFEVLANLKNLSDKQKLKLISLLAKASGAEGMIGGQVIDIQSENLQVDLETLKEIHIKKTAMLIQASIEFGAIMSSADELTHETLKNFGLKIGLAFQIVDDILDITASKEKHGRDIASDIINKKTTYVSLLGIQKCQEVVDSLTLQALNELKTLPYPTELLEEFTKSLIHRKN